MESTTASGLGWKEHGSPPPPPSGRPCQSCGAPVDADDRFCPACGQSGPATGDGDQAADVAQQRFQCKNCGSEVARDAGQRSFTCPFCDSNYVVELAELQTGRHAPEFIIGFAVTPAEAERKFQEWIGRNAWFRPGDLKRSQLADKIRGVYLPFWRFSMLAESDWSARIGEYWWRTETYTTTDSKGKTTVHTRQVRETEWWPLQGRHHQYHSGYLVSGSRGLTQAEADRIKPFELAAMKRYAAFYLAGWMCEEYSVQRDDALEISRAEFLRREAANVAAFLPGDTYGDLKVGTSLSRINSDLCLLPAYVLSYQYQEKVYRFLVNGQTGLVSGEKPVSAKRITVVVVIVALLVIAVLVLVSIFGAR